jgi:hypothetical protein
MFSLDHLPQTLDIEPIVASLFSLFMSFSLRFSSPSVPPVATFLTRRNAGQRRPRRRHLEASTQNPSIEGSPESQPVDKSKFLYNFLKEVVKNDITFMENRASPIGTRVRICRRLLSQCYHKDVVTINIAKYV